MIGKLLEKIRRKRPLTRGAKYALLAAVPMYFMIAGLIVQPFPEIVKGVITIFQEPDFLITDYFAIGGIGAAFFNAGILTLCSVAIMYFLRMEIDGHTITSTFLMFGFSLFGKNILNIWSILMGVWLYARYHKTSLTKYIYIGFYGTSLSPIITQIMQMGRFPTVFSLLLSIAAGIVIGFVLPPLSTHLYYAHKGYSLYNVGFSAGIIATVIVSLLKSFGISTESRLIWSTGNNTLFYCLLSIFFVGFIFSAFLFYPDVWKTYRNVLKSTGIGHTDYVKSDGFGAVLMNMGVNGLAATTFVVLVGGDLNGPTIGGILTIVGFGSTGKHLRNILPVMAGVWIAGIAKTWDLTDPSAMLAFLFSTTLAPIAGEFGVLAGVLAGFLHSSVAMNVGMVYGGMNLYNNGFAGGIIAAFLVPVIQSVKDRRARAKSEVSL